MTPQEMQALDTFLTQLVQANTGTKDAQAEARIADAAARQPDAAYLLVQRAMLLDHALASAKAQIVTLQSQLQAAQAAQAAQVNGGSHFLDGDSAWGNSAGRAVPPAAMPASMQPAPQPMPPSMQQPMPQSVPQPARPGFLGGGLGGALGSIASTAAGVAGGAFLFQGLENLFHRNSGGGGFFGQPALGSMPAEPTVVNNYYDNGDGGSAFDARERASDGGFLDSGLDAGLDNDDFLNDDSSIV